MLDPDIQSLVELGDLVAATGLYQQRHGGSVLAARKAIDAASWALTQSRGAALDPHHAEPRPALAATLVMDPQLDAALRADRKIEAIKRYRELHGVGLKEARDAVEAILAGKPPPTPTPVRQPEPEPEPEPKLQPELDRLIRADQKIMAIKHYREITRVGLREAKDAVEARMAELARQPPPRPVVSQQPGIQPELDRLIRVGQKLLAIKHYRTLTGIGLKEAKDAVEARQAELGL